MQFKDVLHVLIKHIVILVINRIHILAIQQLVLEYVMVSVYSHQHV